MKVGNKKIYDSFDSERISDICLSLQQSVTEIQVINWLENFEFDERNLALTVLEAMRFYSLNDIVYNFDESLKKILNTIDKDGKIFIHGLGDFGKSGSSLIYYITKTPTYKNNQSRFKLLSHVNKIKQQGVKEGSFLLLIDDIIGSGKSLVSYFNHNIKQQLLAGNLKINVLVLCIAYMQDSIKELSKNISELMVFGTPYKKAFSSDSSVFGYRPKMLPIRNFCYKYGINLCTIYDREQKKNIAHPLGYNKSQSLIAFAHSVPNNTLPIIWSSLNTWQPLFPRSAMSKISQAKNFRTETRHWLLKAYKFSIFKVERTEDKIYFKDLDYKVLAVMRLKKRKSSEPIICQILGVSINELSEIYSEGIKIGVFDDNCELSCKGLDDYNNVKKKILISNAEEKRKFNNLRNNGIYIPKTFLGKA